MLCKSFLGKSSQVISSTNIIHEESKINMNQNPPPK